MKRNTLTLLLLLTIVLSVSALDFDLKSYIDQVEKHSRDLIQATKDLALADQQIQQVKANVLPSVGVSGSYNRNFLDITQPTPIGARTTAVPGPSGDMYPLIAPSMDINQDNEFSVSLGVNQALFNLKAWYALELAKVYRGLSDTTYKLKRQSILTMAKKFYYQALLMEKIKGAKESSEKISLENYEQMRIRRDAGIATDLNLLQSEVNWRNAIPETAKAKKNYDLSLINLKSVAGIPLDDPIGLTDRLEEYPNLPEKVPLVQALDARLDYSLMLHQQSIAGINRSLANADFYPVVSASLNYTTSSSSNGFRFDENSRSILQLGIKVSLPVFQGGYRAAALATADISVDKAGIDLAKMRDNVSYELTSITLILSEARTRIDSASTVLAAARKAYDMSKLSFESGVITQLEFKESTLNLEQSQILYYSAIFEYLSDYFDWEKAAGK